MQIQPPVNLKEYKNGLRARYKELRRAIPPQRKAAADSRIANRFFRLGCYRRCSTLLIYVSSPIEVGTKQIITRAFSDGKRVAVPRCVPGTREMEFYWIEGYDDLEPGAFGILEPQPNPDRLLTDWTGCLCIVPALACDRKGYRLGYGGGYYDRFLRGFPGTKVLILYKKCLIDHIWHGRYDVAVDLIVTEYFTHAVAHAAQPGKSTARPHSVPAKRLPKTK